jgi:hypothetical protein
MIRARDGGIVGVHHGPLMVTVRLSGRRNELEDWHIITADGAWDVATIEAQTRDIADAAGAVTTVKVVPAVVPPRRGPDVLDVVVAIASWAATSAAWDAMKALASALARRLHGTIEIPASPLTDSEAVKCARWLVSERYGEDSTSLVVACVDISEDRSAQVLLEGHGWDYACWLELCQDDLITLARIRCRRRGSS